MGQNQIVTAQLLSLEQTGGPDQMFVLVGVAVILFLLILIFELAQFISNFSRELWYLNMEVGRTEGEERRYYQQQRRRLWLSLLFFWRY